MADQTAKTFLPPLDPWQKGAQLALPVGVIAVLGIMILPVPPFLLDFFLSLSITLAITILLIGFFIDKPLEFSVFPAVLLVSTLFRLSLNIASTRLILLRGEQGPDAAGKVIASFGQFVVGGEYVVGLVVFVILVVINFVVITKGAGRIAEVAARFTLDAMPGKQMSIDADLNAGLIGEAEARERRERISNEADFYGAMDGASKFVRGDAIAGIIITAVNILGGLAIGVLKKGMAIGEAAQTYTLLTVGDGLVSQIPALLVSTAAGIVVSRTATEGDFATTIQRQLFGNPTVLYLSSVILLFMVMPLVPWGLREAVLIVVLVYLVFTLSTLSVKGRFDADTLLMLQFAMLGAGLSTLTVITRAILVRREDIKSRYELLKAHDRMALLSLKDPLTGAWNRRFLEQKFSHIVSDFHAHGDAAHFVLIDVDNFKQLNDAHGHDYGDLVLRRLVASFLAQFSGHEHLVRMGGDEFAMVMSGNEAEASIRRGAAALRTDTELFAGSADRQVFLSVGLVTIAPGQDASLDTVYRLTDQALYKAKKSKIEQLPGFSLEAVRYGV